MVLSFIVLALALQDAPPATGTPGPAPTPRPTAPTPRKLPTFELTFADGKPVKTAPAEVSLRKTGCRCERDCKKEDTACLCCVVRFTVKSDRSGKIALDPEEVSRRLDPGTPVVPWSIKMGNTTLTLPNEALEGDFKVMVKGENLVLKTRKSGKS